MKNKVQRLQFKIIQTYRTKMSKKKIKVKCAKHTKDKGPIKAKNPFTN